MYSTSFELHLLLDIILNAKSISCNRMSIDIDKLQPYVNLNLIAGSEDSFPFCVIVLIPRAKSTPTAE